MSFALHVTNVVNAGTTLCFVRYVVVDLHGLLSGDEATSLRVCIIHGVYTCGIRTCRVSSAAEAFICRGSFNCVSSVQRHRGHVVDQHLDQHAVVYAS